ncbi:HNH endonuclease family protein [Marinobacter nauticus]
MSSSEKAAPKATRIKLVPNLVGVLTTLILISITPSATADTIKKTASGICHPPESSYYERVKSFDRFKSVESCVRSGGRIPKGLSLRDDTTKANDDYDRSRFGHGWQDDDGDCQNSRMEALIEQSTVPVRFATNKKCRVVSGRWLSPFTGNVIHNASDIDIDHVVPLKWAWNHGASEWTQEKREAFANDPRNLWTVEISLNRQKGAKGPDEWLPPQGKCGYISRFNRLIKIYSLESKSTIPHKTCEL